MQRMYDTKPERKKNVKEEGKRKERDRDTGRLRGRTERNFMCLCKEIECSITATQLLNFPTHSAIIVPHLSLCGPDNKIKKKKKQ